MLLDTELDTETGAKFGEASAEVVLPLVLHLGPAPDLLQDKPADATGYPLSSTSYTNGNHRRAVRVL
jgi:hypothetical protein